jgi:sugar phosphate isomerase/epimerase
METGLSFSLFGKKTYVMGGTALAPEERHFAQCAEHGIRRVELVIMEGYITPGDTPAIQRIRRLAEHHGVSIHSIHGPSGWPTNGYWLADPDDDARRRNVAERVLALEGARDLGAQYMVVEFEAYDQWPYWPHGQTPEQSFPGAADQWRKSFDELLTAAVQLGMTLAVENIDGAPNALLPELMNGLTRREAGICFDSSHATYGGDFPGQLRMLAPYVIGTHLSDNDGLDGAAWVDRHWFPFTGAIDWPSTVNEILTKAPCDCLMLEVLDRDNPQISPALMEAVRRLRDHVPLTERPLQPRQSPR